MNPHGEIVERCLIATQWTKTRGPFLLGTKDSAGSSAAKLLSFFPTAQSIIYIIVEFEADNTTSPAKIKQREPEDIPNTTSREFGTSRTKIKVEPGMRKHSVGKKEELKSSTSKIKLEHSTRKRTRNRSDDIERDEPVPKRSRTSPSVASWSFINNDQSEDKSSTDLDSELEDIELPTRSMPTRSIYERLDIKSLVGKLIYLL